MSERSILVRQIGQEGWVSPETSEYQNEGHLQSLLADDPTRIPGITHGALTARELPTSAGPIDVAVISQEGDLTVVECKLSSNSERRRMVVGQVLDYASAIWLDGPDALFAAWHRRTDLDVAHELDDGSLSQLRHNIEDGRINLCLVVDQIDDDLRRLIEYLNRITTDYITVTAIQLAYARHGGVEILIPDTYGGEIAAVKTRAATGGGDRWTQDSFLDALATDEDRAIAVELFRRAEALTPVRGPFPTFWYGQGERGAIGFQLYGLHYAPFCLRIDKNRRLMAVGDWGSVMGRDPEAFAEFARFLGLSHLGPRRAVPLAQFDLDDFWQAALRCAEAINDEPTSATAAVSPAEGQ